MGARAAFARRRGRSVRLFRLPTRQLSSGAPPKSCRSTLRRSRAAHARRPPAVLPTVKALDSQRRAMEVYPDLAKAGSPLNKTFVAMVHQLELEHSPRLQQPDWPEQVAAQCAKALLIKPVAGKSAPAVPAAPAPARRPQAAAAPTTAPVAPAATTALVAAVSTTAPPSATPQGAAFVSMDAAYKEKLNTIKYHEHGAAQEATVQVDLHSMAHGASRWVVRCVFFKRPTGHGDRRSVLSKEEKHIEVAAGTAVLRHLRLAAGFTGAGERRKNSTAGSCNFSRRAATGSSSRSARRAPSKNSARR